MAVQRRAAGVAVAQWRGGEGRAPDTRVGKRRAQETGTGDGGPVRALPSRSSRLIVALWLPCVTFSFLFFSRCSCVSSPCSPPPPLPLPLSLRPVSTMFLQCCPGPVRLFLCASPLSHVRSLPRPSALLQPPAPPSLTLHAGFDFLQACHPPGLSHWMPYGTSRHLYIPLRYSIILRTPFCNLNSPQTPLPRSQSCALAMAMGRIP